MEVREDHVSRKPNPSFHHIYKKNKHKDAECQMERILLKFPGRAGGGKALKRLLQLPHLWVGDHQRRGISFIRKYDANCAEGPTGTEDLLPRSWRGHPNLLLWNLRMDFWAAWVGLESGISAPSLKSCVCTLIPRKYQAGVQQNAWSPGGGGAGPASTLLSFWWGSYCSCLPFQRCSENPVASRQPAPQKSTSRNRVVQQGNVGF